MSAPVSSPIPSVARQGGRFPAMVQPFPHGLLAALAKVTEPRKTRGVRHWSTSVVAVGVCAVLAGARSFAGIAEWAHDLSPAVRATLGIVRVPPSESTICRMLPRVDPNELHQVVGCLAADPAAST